MSLPLKTKDVSPFSCSLLDDVTILLYLIDITSEKCLKKTRDVYYFLQHSPAENPGNCSFEPLKLKTFWGEQSPLVCSKFGGLTFRRNPCSGPPKDSKNYRKCVSKFYSTCRPRLLERWLTLNQRLNPLTNG